MKKIAYILILLVGLLAGKMLTAQVPVVDFEGFQPYLKKTADTTYVVNFWATWCKPCVKELPAFEKLNREYRNEKVKVLLVSLDFIKHYDSKLIPFIKKYNLQSEVILLNDPRSNRWIDKVSPEWSGAIPATVIYRGDKRGFYEQSFTYEELENELKKYIQTSKL